MKKIIILFTSILIFASCSKNNELKDSVLIYDSELTDLPQYSEWGYNTFGAYYDREVFISNNYVVPGKVIVSDNAMKFILNGNIKTTNYYGNSGKMSISFNISDFTPQKYSDLTSLNEKSYNLKETSNQVIITIGTTEYTEEVISGKLTFKKVQNLLVDKQPVQVILSGYFELQILIDNIPTTISNGRFDIGIGEDNFYLK